MDSQNTAAPGRAASLDVPLQSELDQAVAVGINTTEQQQPAAEAHMGTTSNCTGVDEPPQATAAQANTSADHEDRADKVSAPVASVADDSSSDRDRKSTGSGSSSSQQPSLSGADLLRELRSMKSENLELVKMLTAQLQEVSCNGMMSPLIMVLVLCILTDRSDAGPLIEFRSNTLHITSPAQIMAIWMRQVCFRVNCHAAQSMHSFT